MEDLNPANLPTILIVEDSVPDMEMILRAFNKLGMKNKIFHCKTGDEGLDFLHRRDKYSDPKKAPRPGIILLDLNLPGTDGREILKEIKSDPELKSIPIVVLTTSSSEKDINECHQNGANSYMVKEVDWNDFFKAIENFKAYCLKTAKIPGSDS